MQGSADPNVELLGAAAFVSHLVPADSVYAFLAEHRHQLFPDDAFADLFPSGRGRPSQPADVISSVLVLQSLEGLSDRDATQALATDLRWKVACGLSQDTRRTRHTCPGCPDRSHRHPLSVTVRMMSPAVALNADVVLSVPGWLEGPKLVDGSTSCQTVAMRRSSRSFLIEIDMRDVSMS